MRFVENNADLEQLCRELNVQPFVTVDLEFVREKSYFSKLCLIQLGWVDDAAIIDPLASEINLQPFFELMHNESVLKVFHSGRQDIEIIYNLSGKVPSPIFDTQVAAMVFGFGPSVSYDNLVREITKVELDKSSRLTDWQKRPLDARQLEYALRDVTFLIPCYEYLVRRLEKEGRRHWIDEELNALLDENLYRPDPEHAWLKIRHTAHSQRFLSVLKELAAWRERRAIKYDVPRKTILKDDILLNIAAAAPRTLEELAAARNVRADVAKGKLGVEIVAAVNSALENGTNVDLRKVDRERQVKIPAGVTALIEVLRLLLKIKSEQYGVVEHLIAGESDLKEIACGNNDKTNPALQGWRYDLFGRYALAFRKGDASIRYDTTLKQIVIVEKDDA